MSFWRRVLGMSDQARPGPDSDYWYTQTGTMSASGQVVTVDKALQLSTVYSCVRVLSETIAALPLCIYRRDADGGKRKAEAHPLYRLLQLQPNPLQTAYRFRQQQVAHLDLRGNAYTRISVGPNGVVDGLWMLEPDRIRVRSEGRRLWYEYTPTTGGREIILPDEILHPRGLSYDGIVGLSPISAQRETLGKALAAVDYGARFFQNDARPGLTASIKGSFKDEAAREAAQKSLREAFTGARRFRAAIFEQGLEFKQIGLTNTDAQFLELLGFSRTEICAIFRVPPHKVGDLSRATFSNIEHQALEFVGDSIVPRCKAIEQEINAHPMLLGGDGVGEDGFYCEFDLTQLLVGDLLSRYRALWIGRQGGWLSANDVRAMLGMNPIEDGDRYLQPQNMVPVDRVDDVLDDNKAPPSDKNPDSTNDKAARAPRLEVIDGRG